MSLVFDVPNPGSDPARGVIIRPATPADYDVYAQLAPELGTGDPILTRERFVADLLATTWIAEDASGRAGPRALGYANVQVLRDALWVRHLVTAPDARRRGIARAILLAMQEHARQLGCSEWCLNVAPQNQPARALYASLGLLERYASEVLRMPWSQLDSMPAPTDAEVVTRPILADDDEALERAMGLEQGRLAAARALPGRVLVQLAGDNAPLGLAVFDPQFPGAFPFRAARPELALVLLHALRPHARAGDPWIQLVIEDQPELAGWLRAHGAALHLEMLQLRAALTPIRGTSK